MFAFSANLPGGGTAPGVLYMKNDGTNLYLAVRVLWAAAGDGQVTFEFDNDGDGVLENGNDVILYGSDGNFLDDFRTNAPPCSPPGSAEGSCAFFDTSDGGTNDGDGAHGHDGTFAIFELVHPLDSADNTHDFSLTPGQTLGVSLSVHLSLPGTGADTVFPGPSQSNYMLVTIAP